MYYVQTKRFNLHCMIQNRELQLAQMKSHKYKKSDILFENISYYISQILYIL